MDTGRPALRLLLALVLALVAAGCASREPPAESDRGADNETAPANESTTETPGCIEQGQTGSGDGDIAADDVCAGAQTGGTLA